MKCPDAPHCPGGEFCPGDSGLENGYTPPIEGDYPGGTESPPPGISWEEWYGSDN